MNYLGNDIVHDGVCYPRTVSRRRKRRASR
jgi:hypothetical protein